MKTKQDFPSINERPPEGIKDDGSKVRVLVVDDSMFVAKQLGQILTSEGYEVVATAGDGQEGVEKYKELCPNVDVVTMDITMPKMDGITALEQIMAFDKNARVVMISALGKEELVKKSLLLGAKNYIVKPLDRKKVLEPAISFQCKFIAAFFCLDQHFAAGLVLFQDVFYFVYVCIQCLGIAVRLLSPQFFAHFFQ